MSLTVFNMVPHEFHLREIKSTEVFQKITMLKNVYLYICFLCGFFERRVFERRASVTPHQGVLCKLGFNYYIEN